MRVSRWGNIVALENLCNPEQRAALTHRIAERFPQICKKIDSYVNEISTIVKAVSPLRLMIRNYWYFMRKSIERTGPEESNLGHDDLLSARMLDYVQSIIVATPDCLSDTETTDEEYQRLLAAVNSLYRTLVTEYFIGRTASHKRQEDFDFEKEKFLTVAEMNYCSVRGHRYLVHDVPHLEQLLLSQSDLINDAFGITANDIIDGFGKLLNSLSQGLLVAMEDIQSFQKDSMDAIELLCKRPESIGLSPPEMLDRVVEENGWEMRRDDVLGRFLGPYLFDVSRITQWPTKLIDALSLSPGEDTALLATEPRAGWPTRFSKTRLHPFVKLDGISYCFDICGLADNFYRSLRRAVRMARPELSDRWNKTQQDVTESLPFRLLQSLLPKANVIRPIFYRTRTGDQQRRDWVECDGILIFDRHLFVVEVRSGAFTHTSAEDDSEAYFSSLSNVIIKPITQANRFINELENSGEVAICDSNHKELAVIRASNFDEITPCCVTLDQLEHIACNLEDVGEIGFDVGTRPIWCVSIDDLRVHSEVFRNPLVFLDFLKERKRASRSPSVRVSDELDHVGAYLHHNRYVMHAERLNGSELNFAHGYRDELDRFFHAKLIGETPKAPGQEMPFRIRQIVELLAQSGKTGRAAAAEKILGLGGEARDELTGKIEEALSLQQQMGRTRPISIFGECRLTVFCDQKPQLLTRVEDAISHTLAVMKLANQSEWTLLQLRFTDAGLLVSVDWRFLTEADLSKANPEQLLAMCDRLERTRKAR